MSFIISFFNFNFILYNFASFVDEWSSKLSKLGETMSTFPVSPRFAKMLALSYQHNLLQYTVCIVAALSVAEIFLNDQGENKWYQCHRSWAGVGNSLLLGMKNFIQ